MITKPYPRHPKLRGEWAEWQFIARAFSLGFRVAKPLGDSCRYDVLIDNPTGFHRVQIKSTTVRERDSSAYRCVYYSSARYHSYSPDDFDFLAAYVIPEDVWFIIPASLITTSSVTLDPLRRYPRNRYRAYREAWRLLQKPSPLNIHAAAQISPPGFLWVEPLLQAAGIR